MVCEDCKDGDKREPWKKYITEDEHIVSYKIRDLKRAAAEGSSAYKQNKPVDGNVEYINGEFVTFHEAPLEDGLLGFTIPNHIYITTANRYGHPKDEIKLHEESHRAHLEWGEYEIRCETDHNARLDIGLEEREAEKRNDSIRISYNNE